MARALETDLINQLEENLQCTVCLGVLKDPRTLPCCHSFCKVCLEGIVETLRGKAPRGRPIRVFPCPYCRATFILHPDKHVADMPRNHFICNMVKVAAVLDRGIGVPCSHNCRQSFSVARCVTCEKFLCRVCLTAHNNYRASNDHSVLTMEQLSKPENRKKIKDKMYCNEHLGMELKVYCETCDQLICRDCMDFKHLNQGHSCFLVKDVANNYKELLASNGKEMEDALTEGNAFLQRLTLTTQQLDRDAKNAKNKIAHRQAFVATKVLEMLNQKAESLCKKVDEIHKGKLANLDRQAEETKLYVENIKTSAQLSKKLVDQGTEEEIISSQKMMLDNANNLLTKRQEYFKAPIPVAKLRYTSSTGKEPINEEILRGLENSLGEVNETSKATERQGGKPSLSPKNLLSLLTFSTSRRHVSFSYANPDTRNVTRGGGMTDQSKNTDQKAGSRDDKCPICLCDFTDRETLSKCGHSFCAGCIDEAFKYQKKCPVCSQVYGPLIGDQPPGEMYESYWVTSLPGFGSWGTIFITYRFSNGTQGPDHPNPGKPYTGTKKFAYLPNNQEGKKVLKLVKKAFKQKLTFTIGQSTTTEGGDCVVWNDIPHKTSKIGGPANSGYPDPDYLRRVQEALAAKGITE